MQVISGAVRRRSTIRLSDEDLALGYALACQTVVEGDITVSVPPQEKIERLLTSDRTAGEVSVPPGYDVRVDQTIQAFSLSLNPPDMSDQTDDWSRLQTALRQQAGLEEVQVSPGCSEIGTFAALQRLAGDCSAGHAGLGQTSLPADRPASRLLYRPATAVGAAIDVGRPPQSGWLIDYRTGGCQVAPVQQADCRGEGRRRHHLRRQERQRSPAAQYGAETINETLEQACKRVKASSR
jgi:uncharacterized 2Fe-2S/4Fe-4S cluster protein (DUF4445 family)